MSRIDTVVPEVKQTISVQLQTLVNTYVTNPVSGMVDGVRCGYLATTYRGMLDGLCHQGVGGFTSVATSYVTCAWLAVALIILMYVIWWNSRNNFYAYSVESRRAHAALLSQIDPYGGPDDRNV